MIEDRKDFQKKKNILIPTSSLKKEALMKKRTISLMLALALVFTLCVGVAAPAQAATYFTVSSSTLTVGSTGTIIPTGSLASLASSITYTSSNPSVVSVSNSSGYGMMTALSAGSAIIYAMLGNSPLETIPITVTGSGYNPYPGSGYNPNPGTGTVSISAGSSQIAVGQSTQLYASGATILSCYSNDTNCLYVTNSGTITGRQQGYATVTVNTTAGTGQITIVVGSYSSTGVYASPASLSVGQSAQMIAGSGSILSVASPDTNLVTVTGSTVTAKASGTARIYVYTNTGNYVYNMVIASSLNIPKTTLAVGETMQLSALNGLGINTCTSSAPRVCSASGKGLLTAVSAGTATIYVTLSNGTSTTVNITVSGSGSSATGSLVASPSTIAVGGTSILSVAGDSILSASSLNPTIASVTNSGVVTGVSAGTATLYVTTVLGKTYTATVTVTASGGSSTKPSGSVEVPIGTNKNLSVKNQTVVKCWDDGAGVVSCSVLNGKGRVTALKAGTTTVYVSTASGATASIVIYVPSSSVTVDPDDVAGSTARVNCDSDLRVIMRRTASSSGSKVATLAPGVRVTITGSSGEYYKVTLTSGGKTYNGYIKQAYLTIQ